MSEEKTEPIRMKFKCEGIECLEDKHIVKMQLSLGAEENKSIATGPTMGAIQITIDKGTDGFGEFDAGKEYYGDFTPAPKTEVKPLEKVN